MEFSTSDYIASAALLISIISAYYTKIGAHYAKKQTDHNTRANLSHNHAEYRIALKNATEKHKADISRLCSAANLALNKATCVFDRYDTDSNHSRPLRHLVNECAEMVFCAFNGQLGWQTSLNIYLRLAQVIRAEDHIPTNQASWDQHNFRASFEEEYFNNKNIHQETRLLTSDYYLNLINQIRERVEATSQGQLLLDIQQELAPFNKIFGELQSCLSATAKELEDLLSNSDLEHFPLEDSPRISNRLRYRIATFNTLSSLNLHMVDEAYADKYYNFVSVSIYNLAILHAVIGFKSWGWSKG